jgi:hypothetical protein
MQANSDIVTSPIKDFARITGLGITSIYAMLNDGRLQSVTIGRKRLVLMSSWYALIQKQLGTPAEKPVGYPPSQKGRGKTADSARVAG